MTESTSAPAISDAVPTKTSRFSAVLVLVWDLGLPLLSFYALHLFGASDWMALLAATAVAGARLLWVAVRTREVTWFAAIMFAVFGFGLLLGLLSGDPRFLLLKDSFSTAGAGLVHLVSLMTSRPLTLSAVQTWKPERAAHLAARYRDDPRTRRVFRVSGLVWGVALIAEAVLRIPVIYLFPVDVAVGLSTLMMVVVCTGVLAWNIRYIARARKRHPGLLADSGLGF